MLFYCILEFEEEYEEIYRTVWIYWQTETVQRIFCKLLFTG